MANHITDQRAEWYGIELQRAGESDHDYRSRVASGIRSKATSPAAAIVEAQEAFNNALYDDPKAGCMDGILGAVAMQVQGINYGGNRPFEDEQVAGEYVRTAPPEPSPLAIALMMAMLPKVSK